jgi:acetylornithine deacetylase
VSSQPGSAVVDLTRSLVAIDSVSPSLAPGAPGETEIAAFVADRLSRSGFEVDIVPGPDERRPSIVGTRQGSRSGRTVVLNGHLDTVGVEGMSEPFSARVDSERMYGRGTSDMKGGLAGLLVAADRLAAADAPGRLIVALVADEEDASVGATAVLESLAARGEKPDVCLIAEPTWLELAVAHRGYEVVKVGLAGRAAHSSQPEEGVDVMPWLGELLVAVSRHDSVLRQAPQHPLLASGSLMATVARAGVAPFMVAAHAEVTVERRTLPGESRRAGLDEVRALIDGLGAPAELEWTVEPQISRAAWQADEAGPAAELMSNLAAALSADGAAAPGRTGAPYWMESALWQEAGIAAVVCGPAGGGLHAADEWVDLAQLIRFPVAVEDAVGRFLSQPAGDA